MNATPIRKFIWSVPLLLALSLMAGASLAAEPAARAASSPAASKATPREIKWEALIPKGWDPQKEMPAEQPGILIDGSPGTLQLMRDMREVWDKAPTNDELAGQSIKLPGYVVPLEETKRGLTEFLLVPYFGACIHTPPPPANQIVHVVVAKPVKGFASMDTVWVSGTLSLSRQDSAMGVSGYKIDAAQVSRYLPSSR